MILSGSSTYDQSSQLIQSINEILSHKWSRKQISLGKKIKIPPEWGNDVMSLTVSRFRKEGWVVRQLVELSSGIGRTYYFEFKNPNWKKYDDQFDSSAFFRIQI